MTYQITVRQTSFWEFTSVSARTRVHFYRKQEFWFVESRVSDFRFADSHPLLADYSCAWKDIFLSSAAGQPRVLLGRIDKSIQDASENWRSLATYREPLVALSVLADGYGSLGSTPAPVADAVAGTLRQAGVSFTELPSRGPRGEFRVMIAGRNWVVAESFRVEELPLDSLLHATEAPTFRAATEADFPFLLELRRRTMSEHLRQSGLEPSERECAERVLANFECAEIIALAGRPIGLLKKVAREGKKWRLIQIQLVPEQQSKGLGTSILKALVDGAKQSGASITLSVLRANPARRLYERSGFRVVSESAHAYEMQFGAEQAN